eukprot:SAG31_NODE_15_length_37942_cov_32.078297_24_plen_182_part_00
MRRTVATAGPRGAWFQLLRPTSTIFLRTNRTATPAQRTMLARCVLLIWLLWCFGLPLALHYHRSGSDVDFDAQTCPGLLADGALAFCCSLVAAVCGLLVALKMLRTVNATVTYELDRVDAEEPFETELPMSFSAFKVLIDHCQTLRFFAAIRLAWPPVLLQSIHAMVGVQLCIRDVRSRHY